VLNRFENTVWDTGCSLELSQLEHDLNPEFNAGTVWRGVQLMFNNAQSLLNSGFYARGGGSNHGQ
jgi:hypothetical protein